MEDEYDCVVLGTGLTECILSGLLSVEKKKVLHIDRNDYYGGACASLHLNELYKQFKPDQPDLSEKIGKSRDFNVDLIPKFLMANGKLVKMLLKTDVTRYLQFKVVAGSYVFVNGQIHKVPATTEEVLKTSLLSLLEKRRFKNFLEFLAKYDPQNPETCKDPGAGWFGKAEIIDFKKLPMIELYKKFSLSEECIDFVGHACALELNDDYLRKPAHPAMMAIRLYFESLSKYSKSPYIYPLYGLGDLPQAFSRLAAIWGGTFMLHTPIDEIVTDDKGKFTGVRSGDQVAKAKFVVGDPSYFSDRVEKTGQCVRIICILNHPIANTADIDSVQIIIPQKQVKRKNDIYVMAVSDNHCVAPKGKYIAIVSTTVETSDPVRECAPGLKLLEPIEERFVSISDTFAPKKGQDEHNIFISHSMDATSHFETTCNDVIDLYRRITGKELDLKKTDQPEQSQQ